MNPKHFTTPLKVCLVTNNTICGISVEMGAQTQIVPTLFKNVKRDSTLSLIVRLLGILLVKEQFQLSARSLEDGALSRHVFLFLEGCHVRNTIRL